MYLELDLMINMERRSFLASILALVGISAVPIKPESKEIAVNMKWDVAKYPLTPDPCFLRGDGKWVKLKIEGWDMTTKVYRNNKVRPPEDFLL